jgi:hypothetical protein
VTEERHADRLPRSPQRPLSGEQLLQATRLHEDAFDRSIDVQVLRLRRKLESDPTAPNVIRTERGGIAAASLMLFWGISFAVLAWVIFKIAELM